MEAVVIALCLQKINHLQQELNHCSDEIQCLSVQIKKLEERRECVRKQLTLCQRSKQQYDGQQRGTNKKTL